MNNISIFAWLWIIAALVHYITTFKEKTDINRLIFLSYIGLALLSQILHEIRQINI